jgi:hypothetical protein
MLFILLVSTASCGPGKKQLMDQIYSEITATAKAWTVTPNPTKTNTPTPNRFQDPRGFSYIVPDGWRVTDTGYSGMQLEAPWCGSSVTFFEFNYIQKASEAFDAGIKYYQDTAYKVEIRFEAGENIEGKFDLNNGEIAYKHLFLVWDYASSEKPTYVYLYEFKNADKGIIEANYIPYNSDCSEQDEIVENTMKTFEIVSR